MERYDITTPRKYERNGEEKTAWDNIGVMFKRDKGGYSIRLNMFPELTLLAFPHEDKPRSTHEDKPRSTHDGSGGTTPADDDIPF